MKKYPGFLVAFEGIDGSGKTTLSNLVYTHFAQKNSDAILTKEPGGTDTGKKIRALVHEHHFSPLAEFLLFAADRAEHMRHVIMPALSAGTLIISDRMADSSRAYQGFGRGLDMDQINSVLAWVMSGIKPDLVIYVRADFNTAHKRIAQRNETLTALEQEKSDFYARVAEGFDTIFANRHDVLIVDALLPVEELVSQIVCVIEARVSACE